MMGSVVSRPSQIIPGVPNKRPRPGKFTRIEAQWDRVAQVSVVCFSELALAPMYTFSESLQDLPDVQELITQVRSEKCSLQAAAILDADDSHQTETSFQVKDNKPLVERFETFCLDPSLVTKQANLVHFPPGFQPIPCKPLFFDLALNHVAFPPLEDKLEQKTKSGLTGYIKGIFGFRS
ncbi:signal recognition particle subunit srp68 [Saguinus oedipus]|uniref:Signal recognition particle subunit srp68 n=1 Tax=Saguinus oedipus TaxID=9490 RepID=A0ABQ9VRT1_SAGOE|nr:signal recognition particle subunit srp68 [Saguinus oedipus]